MHAAIAAAEQQRPLLAEIDPSGQVVLVLLSVLFMQRPPFNQADGPLL